ncbi:MAG TPA: hypothetical protein PKG65_09945 [Ferruginibacter sp.]|nr:hypothetical protein [Ferruginibacter sp.]
MKHLLYVLLAVISLAGCRLASDKAADTALQQKTKLLKLAGFSKMEQSFTYERTEKAGLAADLLSLLPPDTTHFLREEDVAKDKLLNVFATPDGKQYSTFLRKSGTRYAVRIVSIDGNVFEETVFVPVEIPAGGLSFPPPDCLDDCSNDCINRCLDYYKRSVFPALQDSANRTCRRIYFRFMCPLNARSCHADMLKVFVPDTSSCSGPVFDPGKIATRRMNTVFVINRQADPVRSRVPAEPPGH